MSFGERLLTLLVLPPHLDNLLLPPRNLESCMKEEEEPFLSLSGRRGKKERKRVAAPPLSRSLSGQLAPKSMKEREEEDEGMWRKHAERKEREKSRRERERERERTVVKTRPLEIAAVAPGWVQISLVAHFPSSLLDFTSGEKKRHTSKKEKGLPVHRGHSPGDGRLVAGRAVCATSS